MQVELVVVVKVFHYDVDYKNTCNFMYDSDIGIRYGVINTLEWVSFSRLLYPNEKTKNG